MGILKGGIYITDKIEVIYNIPLNGPMKVISLDEDGVLAETENILKGTCLLPPIEAKIAEVDGNESQYDMIYSDYLMQPYQREFIGALLSVLYKGGSLMIFLPEIGYNNTMNKFIRFMWELYGVHIGIVDSPNPNEANCYYDETCVPMWLNMIYASNVIDAYEYLTQYPIDAIIESVPIMDKLVDEINPCADTINDRRNYIIHLHQQLHKNPKVRPAVTAILRRYY